jgi:hypothetical protein
MLFTGKPIQVEAVHIQLMLLQARALDQAVAVEAVAEIVALCFSLRVNMVATVV